MATVLFLFLIKMKIEIKKISSFEKVYPSFSSFHANASTYIFLFIFLMTEKDFFFSLHIKSKGPPGCLFVYLSIF